MAGNASVAALTPAAARTRDGRAGFFLRRDGVRLRNGRFRRNRVLTYIERADEIGTDDGRETFVDVASILTKPRPRRAAPRPARGVRRYDQAWKFDVIRPAVPLQVKRAAESPQSPGGDAGGQWTWNAGSVFRSLRSSIHGAGRESQPHVLVEFRMAPPRSAGSAIGFSRGWAQLSRARRIHEDLGWVAPLTAVCKDGKLRVFGTRKNPPKRARVKCGGGQAANHRATEAVERRSAGWHNCVSGTSRCPTTRSRSTR